MTFVPCTAGYYCPQGTTTEVPCTDLSITLCATGSKFEGGTSASCTAGYYLSGTLCKFCDKGYVCTDGSEKSNPTTTAGYICPVGNYCDPEISFTEIPCPVGTYNTLIEGKTIDDCLLCGIGYYQSATGSSTCLECGTGATTVVAGAIECSCKGNFRWWKSEVNQCQCKKTYTSDPTKYEIFRTSGEFEALDCGLSTCNPTCGTGQFCNTNMTCSSYNCDSVCSTSGGGSWSSNYQQCICNTATADACDTTCLAQASDFYYQSSDSTYCCDFKCDVLGVNQVVCKTATELDMYTGGTIQNGTLSTMKSGTSASYECPATMLAFAPS
jgi:hypothetical protein